MSLTYAGKLAFSKQLESIIKENIEELKKTKVDVEGRINELLSRINVALTEDGKQETLETDLKAQRQKTVEATDSAYSYASSTVDLLVSALGKSHELSKRIRQLRDQIALETEMWNNLFSQGKIIPSLQDTPFSQEKILPTENKTVHSLVKIPFLKRIFFPKKRKSCFSLLP